MIAELDHPTTRAKRPQRLRGVAQAGRHRTDRQRQAHRAQRRLDHGRRRPQLHTLAPTRSSQAPTQARHRQRREYQAPSPSGRGNNHRHSLLRQPTINPLSLRERAGVRVPRESRGRTVCQATPTHPAHPVHRCQFTPTPRPSSPTSSSARSAVHTGDGASIVRYLTEIMEGEDPTTRGRDRLEAIKMLLGICLDSPSFPDAEFMMQAARCHPDCFCVCEGLPEDHPEVAKMHTPLTRRAARADCRAAGAAGGA